ncbi:hypothetical protein HAX54_048830 [Datura stramonium]|uniref:Pentatricopeptide repeat-containing protein n=1 Tax=Datura stramonium TaxID=4076 RepID=A0ABS8SVV5_DATST|nr:hypothetical protein [Datura stramonium]
MKGMERCSPSIVTYNILLRAFAQAKNVEQVDALLKDLDESIVTPDIFTFNGLMDAYGKNGMIKEMEHVLSRMKSYQLKPDIITFNILIDSYGKKQEFQKMEQVASYITYECLIVMYGHCDCVSKQEILFDRVMESEKEKKVSTLNSMLDTYCMNGLPVEAHVLFESIHSAKSFPIDSSTYKLLYKAYTKADMKELGQNY